MADSIRPWADPSAALKTLEQLYDERVAGLYGQPVAAVADRATADAAIEDAFRQVARVLPRLAPTADIPAVLELTVQRAIAARSTAPIARPARAVTSALAAWRMTEAALAQATDEMRPVAERDYVRAWTAYQDALEPGVAIIVADDGGRYEAVNDAGCALFGRSEAALLALAVEQVTDPEVAHGVREVWQRFLRTGAMAGTFEIARPDGDLCLVDFQALADTPLPGHHVSRLTRPAVGRVAVEAGPDRPLVRESATPPAGNRPRGRTHAGSPDALPATAAS